MLETSLLPQELLSWLQNIEHSMGRKRDVKWGPRIIDLDILFFGDRVINTSELIIPHPALASRRFVLEPLAEIAPAMLHPREGKTISQLLAEAVSGRVGLHVSG